MISHPTDPTAFCAATSSAVRQALGTSLTRILTPKTSTDLLLSIRNKRSSPLPSTQLRDPYSITFVGVNGVGKSTNLSKVCFWLVQNGLRVLIAACDTFRSVPINPWSPSVLTSSLILQKWRCGTTACACSQPEHARSGPQWRGGQQRQSRTVREGLWQRRCWHRERSYRIWSVHSHIRLVRAPVSELNAFIARDHEFDVVLIDTAGRMQDNEVRH